MNVDRIIEQYAQSIADEPIDGRAYGLIQKLQRELFGNLTVGESVPEEWTWESLPVGTTLMTDKGCGYRKFATNHWQVSYTDGWEWEELPGKRDQNFSRTPADYPDYKVRKLGL